MNVTFDRDINTGTIHRKTVAILGYGSQGRAHALNLRDSGVPVIVGLRAGSSSAPQAERDGVEVANVSNATRSADVVVMLIPDEEQAAVYVREVAPNLRPHAYLGFAHGFAIHFGAIVPSGTTNVFMVAPKGPGRLVRSEYEAGRGVPCLVAVDRDPSGDTREIALAYAAAVGGGRAGILETTFREETESDLFGEQAVLCGGMSALVTAGFETLVDAGYAPEMAYFECLHEMKLIVDLMYERGIEGMREGISNTAKFGDYTRGTKVIDERTRESMRAILSAIQDGSFAQEWIAEHAAGKPTFAEFRRRGRAHPIEAIGERLRRLMPWMQSSQPQTAGSR